MFLGIATWFVLSLTVDRVYRLFVIAIVSLSVGYLIGRGR